MADGDEERGWVRQVLVAVAALAVISLVIGAVVSVLALGVARFGGLSGASSSEPTRAASLYLPPLSPEASPSPAAEESPSPSAAGSASRAPKKPKPKRISLQAVPPSAAAMQRVNLTGVYRRGEGVSLQVQRFENGWVDFPTSATVRGGIFTTYVVTGRRGENRFRVLDKAAGRASNPVTVTIG